MKCPNCHAELSDDSKFCNYCGEKLNIVSKERESDTRPRDEKFDYVDQYVRKEPVEKAPDHEQKLWVIFAILGAGVLFAIVAVLLFYALKSNQKTVVQTVSQTIMEETMTSQLESKETEPPSESSISEITKAEEVLEETLVLEEPTDGTSVEDVTEIVAEDTTALVETEAAFVSKEEKEYGGMIYMLSDTEAYLKRCYSTDAVIALSDLIYDRKVTAVSESAFSGCTHITHMDLPDGLTKIQDHAFSDCTGLVEIVIPPTVTEISDSAFSGVSNLTIIGTPGSLAQSYATRFNFSFQEGVTVSPFLGQ